MARVWAELTESEILSVEELDNISNNSVIYKDNSGNYQELALGSSGTVLQSNGETVAPSFGVGGGSGDVVGPGSSTDNAIARFDSTTGKLIQNSGATIDDSNNVSGLGIDADNNTITNIGVTEFDTNTQDSFALVNCLTLDDTDVTVTSNGTTITLNFEKDGGGDVRFIFSDGVYTLDCTPTATVTLTAGSDTSPQINYVYLLQSTKTITVSTTGFPTGAEYSAIATVLCQSAASLQTDGAYKLQAWTDHVVGDNNNGHIQHINYWIRQQPATWKEGVVLTPTVGASTFDIATTSGVILQLHEQNFPAFDTSTGSEVYVPNHPDTAYRKVANLTQAAGVDKDANGNILGGASNDFYNLVIWGVASQNGTDSKIMCNVPNSGYPNDNASQASLDTEGTAIYDIPTVFRGTGFLIARITIEENTGTYTVINQTDLRGLNPSTAASGSAGGQSNEFSDNVFRIQDESDTSKEIAFQASGITTGNTRTFTAPDADGTLLIDGDIGSSVQAYNAKLDSLAGLTPGAEGKMIISDGLGGYQISTVGDVKVYLSLGNVDNTSDATKNSATATLTNKTIDLTDNALSGTKAEFDSACSDGDFAYQSDIGVSIQAYDADTTKNDVANTFTQNQTISNTQPTLYFDETDESLDWRIDVSGDTMRFIRSAGVLGAFTSTGLGIGTTSPGYKLDVAGVLNVGVSGSGEVRVGDASFYKAGGSLWKMEGLNVGGGSTSVVALAFGTTLNTGLYGTGSTVSVAIGASNRATFKSNTLNLTLPTSSAGLSSGDLWNSAGTVKIV